MKWLGCGCGWGGGGEGLGFRGLGVADGRWTISRVKDSP